MTVQFRLRNFRKLGKVEDFDDIEDLLEGGDGGREGFALADRYGDGVEGGGKGKGGKKKKKGRCIERLIYRTIISPVMYSKDQSS